MLRRTPLCICSAKFVLLIFFFPLDINCFNMVYFLVIVWALGFSCRTIFLWPITASVGLIFEYFFIEATCFLGYHLVWVQVAMAAISPKHGGNICYRVMFQARPPPPAPSWSSTSVWRKLQGQLQGKSIPSSSLALGKFLEARLGKGNCHRTLPD